MWWKFFDYGCDVLGYGKTEGADRSGGCSGDSAKSGGVPFKQVSPFDALVEGPWDIDSVHGSVASSIYDNAKVVCSYVFKFGKASGEDVGDLVFIRMFMDIKNLDAILSL